VAAGQGRRSARGLKTLGLDGAGAPPTIRSALAAPRAADRTNRRQPIDLLRSQQEIPREIVSRRQIRPPVPSFGDAF
jgi:hypothetical protein